MIKYSMKYFLQYQIIRMISEGSCDTEDFSNGCLIFSFAIKSINYIFKNIKIENSHFNV